MLLSALGRPLLRLDSPTFAACFQCGFRFNTYIALAIASRLDPAAGVALLSALLGLLVPLVNIAAVTALAQGRSARVALEIARNPLVIACAAGLGWRATGLPLPAIPLRVLEHLASAALPLGLLAVGAGLRFGGHALPPAAVAWWTGVKLLAMPALALALARLAELAVAGVRGRGDDGRGADGAVGLHPGEPDERPRRTGGAGDFDRDAASPASRCRSGSPS